MLQRRNRTERQLSGWPLLRNWGRDALLLLVLLLAGCAGPPQRDVTLQSLTGASVQLSDYRGQVVLVNFWATWCAPCRFEMPELDAYYRQHQARGFTLLAVNSGESAVQVQEYIERFGYSFPVMLDQQGRVADYFGGLRGMPTTFVLDPAGKVVYQHIGMITAEVLESKVTTLLKPK